MERSCSGAEGERGMMTARGWAERVTVVAEAGGPAPDGIKWSLVSKLKKDDVLLFDKTKDNMPKHDYYLVEFDIDDQGHFGLRFQPNPMNAFWVVSDPNVMPQCPQNAAYCDEIYVTCVNEGGDRMYVRNNDHTVATFRFSLGFLKADGSSVRYDPIGQNNDGGI